MPSSADTRHEPAIPPRGDVASGNDAVREPDLANEALAVPISRQRLADEAAHRLRELILTQQLQPGAKLLQIELAEKLGISRTPLREALRQLEQDGLIRVVNGNRTMEVVAFSANELRDLYELREVIDGLAARLLARNGMTKKVANKLRSSLRDMQESMTPFVGETFLRAHTAFHTEIALASGNSRVVMMAPLIRMSAASLREAFPVRLVNNEHSKARAFLEEGGEAHLSIYEHILAQDEIAAEAAARQHIVHTLTSPFIVGHQPAPLARAVRPSVSSAFW